MNTPPPFSLCVYYNYDIDNGCTLSTKWTDIHEDTYRTTVLGKITLGHHHW